ncbi:hypothetical protein [Lentibacillus amyloliquefaciens]|uniref:Uncharacterized protein n=1 Tax=Lentibacillus amyloliquefaciens TaxID=1472767 RepID=A0A0U4FK00_9BACI|nr:hypothetical protein [Lentibacillus amyloliquefaciens]ALX48084.1 hypothetical protein AOX59_05365 [Lentibacillus amyloliquefaciens]
MRFFALLTIVITLAAVIFKWRFRIVNTLLAVSFLRQAVVTISMNMPAIREKIMPALFQRQTVK